jgi:hypothetical protein
VRPRSALSTAAELPACPVPGPCRRHSGRVFRTDSGKLGPTWGHGGRRHPEHRRCLARRPGDVIVW